VSFEVFTEIKMATFSDFDMYSGEHAASTFRPEFPVIDFK
jgi:hypothetical protein